MDLATLAALITAVSAGVASAFGIYYSRRRDSVAARNEANRVATEASEAAVEFLKVALDHSRGELSRLGVRVDELERELIKCQTDHAHKDLLVDRLEKRLSRIEVERERWETEREGLLARIVELGGGEA